MLVMSSPSVLDMAGYSGGGSGRVMEMLDDIEYGEIQNTTL